MSVPKGLGSRTLRSTVIRVPVADQHSLLPETCRELFRTPLAAAGGLLPINTALLTEDLQLPVCRQLLHNRLSPGTPF